MAVYTSPTETHEHYIERDTGGGGSAAGIWAVIAVLIVLFAILFFGTNVFGRKNNSSTDINIRGSVETPNSGSSSGSNTGSGAPTQ